MAISLIPSSPALGRRHLQARAEGTADQPAWRFDLRSVGYSGFAPKREQWGLHFQANPICFSDSNTLIATFITRENAADLARRDEPKDSLPLKLHGIFLDAAAGKVRAAKEWSIARPRGGIVAAGDGRFVVLTPAFIGSYSPDLKLLNEFKLSPDQQSHLWNFYPSPTGKSILVEYNDCMPHCSSQPPTDHESQNPDTSFQWLGTDFLQPQASWSDRLPGVSISDTELAFPKATYLESTGVSLHEVLIRVRDGPWRTFCRERLGYDIRIGCDYPEFVSDDVLALYGPHALNLAPAKGGAALLTAKFREGEWIGRPLHPSADGNRLAVSVWAHKGGSEILDIDYHAVLKRIMVFDITSRQWAYTLDAKKQKIKIISGLALSPDGSLMAILADGIVEVYQLPAARGVAGDDSQ